MSIEIRNYQSSDIFRLYEICLQTGKSGQDATGTIDSELLGHIYAAPYVHADPSLCFVLTDNGWPSGYILGTSDSNSFNQWLEANWWPQIRKKYPMSDTHDARTRNLVKMIHDSSIEGPPYFAEYPAHLHIDLVASVQGAGHGARMMEKYFEALTARAIPGVHLGVGRGNDRAVNWYPRFGFEVIFEDEHSLVFGLKF